jgi:hypothetical protein
MKTKSYGQCTCGTCGQLYQVKGNYICDICCKEKGVKIPKRLTLCDDYESLALNPLIVAETVANRPYTGSEWSVQLRSNALVQKIETKRLKLTPDQITKFAELCDKRCNFAYKHKAKWFLKCVCSKSNAGRDKLYMWCSHWLAAFCESL